MTDHEPWLAHLADLILDDPETVRDELRSLLKKCRGPKPCWRKHLKLFPDKPAGSEFVRIRTTISGTRDLLKMWAEVSHRIFSSRRAVHSGSPDACRSALLKVLELIERADEGWIFDYWNSFRAHRRTPAQLTNDLLVVRAAFREHYDPKKVDAFEPPSTRDILDGITELMAFVEVMPAYLDKVRLCCEAFVHHRQALGECVAGSREIACGVLLDALPLHIHEDAARKGRFDAAGLQQHVYDRHAGWTQRQVLSPVLKRQAVELYAAAYLRKGGVLAEIDLPRMHLGILRQTLLDLDGIPGLEVVRVEDPNVDFDAPANLSFAVGCLCPEDSRPLVQFLREAAHPFAHPCAHLTADPSAQPSEQPSAPFVPEPMRPDDCALM